VSQFISFNNCSLILYCVILNGIRSRHCVVQSHPFAEVVNGKYVSNPWYSIPLKPNQVQIVVGTNIGIVADRKNRYKAKRIIVHSGYSKLKENHDLTVPFELVPYTNDIALIEIDGALELGENVKALEIAPEKFSPECTCTFISIFESD